MKFSLLSNDILETFNPCLLFYSPGSSVGFVTTHCVNGNYKHYQINLQNYLVLREVKHKYVYWISSGVHIQTRARKHVY